MDPFKKRQLGRTNVMLPHLGMGGGPLGDMFTKITDPEAEATLATAWDAGVRYYDTAPWYGRGQSEHRFGRQLYQRPRSEFILSTKVGRLLRPPANPESFDRGLWVGGLPLEIHWDYSYDGIMRSYQDSLQRLGLTSIDMLIIHDLDFLHHKTEPLVTAHLTQLATSGYRALAELKACGQITAIGAGINELGMIPRFLDLLELDFFMLAMRYTLGEHEALEKELPLCQARGVGVVLAGVFSSGLYATGPVPGATYNYVKANPAQLERAGKVEAICKRHAVPLAAAALQFPMHHPLVASVIPGGFRPEHVRTNLELFRRDIPPALWAELKTEGLIRKDAPTGA